ncbi:molecular chaperone DnaJ [Pseudoalteromonas porphyrae]|uniref:DNA-J related domain-containing protein n=1 Tax=Pseudoalteromonas TaxID=53246 RepID=UPI0006BA9944|nr:MULTISPECIES: DNA-J related domain-containing protein [Pseudoalteromonas]KPH94401.1 molecular chaperone DnaJ [Pseudoalteromonas porphyrae]
MLNPLIDEIFELILTKQVWMVHTLALKLKDRGVIDNLDPLPERDLFKRNFLIMNALYQLQQQVLPTQQLLISSLHIELITAPSNHSALDATDPLRIYYLDWNNFETSSVEIEKLLNSFWHSFTTKTGSTLKVDITTRELLLKRWQLPPQSKIKDVQKRWRQLAIQYHPDKTHGNADKFKQLKSEYEQLKSSCSTICNG